MSLNWRRKKLHLARLCLFPCLLAAATLSLQAQYLGKVNEAQKAAPAPRSLAVLEWTGDASSPKASRLVPITVFDDGDFQPGGLYLARPAPLAVLSETLYELQQSGVPEGLFTVTEAGRLDDRWFGYGTREPLQKPKPPKSMESRLTPEVVVDADDDKPHLKRHPGSEAPEDAGKPGVNTASTTKDKTPSSDQKASQASAPPPAPDDPDRPHLRRRPKVDASSAPEPAVQAMGPAAASDPDRPRLTRGKPQETTVVADKLTGTPANLHQMVAVSDAADRPPHDFAYNWANADEQSTARSTLEQLAWQEIAPPEPKPAKAPVRRTHTRKIAASPKPAAPQPHFAEEQFKAFELAYGSGSTIVFTARTEGEGASQRFITLIAQPDLYGKPQILLKQVTDGAHLDQTPQMRLIDAVDADGDNRAELLFELRGPEHRQFALYRVNRSQVEQVFATAAMP